MGDGGPATAALLREPHGLALDNISRRLFVADRGNHVVRSVDQATGVIETVAGVLGSAGYSGDGERAASARLRYPAGLALDQVSERLFVADLGNSVVRALD